RLLPIPTLLSLFLHEPATPELYTLSLHDALPILRGHAVRPASPRRARARDPARARLRSRQPSGTTSLVADLESRAPRRIRPAGGDRKSTRLNSSHLGISYAVFCLKKKKKTIIEHL